jgi:hypothetical protein
MNSSSACITITSNVHRTQEAKVAKNSCWQGAMMANSGQQCDNDKQFRVLIGM